MRTIVQLYPICTLTSHPGEQGEVKRAHENLGREPTDRPAAWR